MRPSERQTRLREFPTTPGHSANAALNTNSSVDVAIRMIKNTGPTYADLVQSDEMRSKELSVLLAPYIGITDHYGEIVCRIVVILGKTPPASPRDAAARDLIADVFDFLYESRALITKGKLEIAYPLARRAY